MSHYKKILLSFLLSLAVFYQSLPVLTASASSSDPFPFVILSRYKASADIGDETLIIAVTSNGKQPTWKSSNSRVASVNTYGIVTAKKAGSALITAKIKNAEASCYITVNKTKVEINPTSVAVERGEVCKLSAKASNGSAIVWKSSKKSIATVDEYGTVTGIKPGTATITAKADGTTAACSFTVKSPTVKLNYSSIRLYRGQSVMLFAAVSSKISPTWKTNKKSVAVVDSDGTVTAVKNGTATISATVDKVTAVCEITVQKPEIKLDRTEITLKEGCTQSIIAVVSSRNLPVWSSSNTNVAAVNTAGQVTALKKGKAYIYASEDGTKVRCTVYVTE